MHLFVSDQYLCHILKERLVLHFENSFSCLDVDKWR